MHSWGSPLETDINLAATRKLFRQLIIRRGVCDIQNNNTHEKIT